MPNLKYWINKHFRFFSLVNPTLLSAALAIVLLFFFTEPRIAPHSLQSGAGYSAHLQTSLNSFSELITIWQQQNLGALQMLVNSSQGKILLKQVLLEQGSNPVTHEALGDWLYRVLTVMGFDGFSVINHERIPVAASTKSYRQQPVLLPETMEVLDKALAQTPGNFPSSGCHPPP